MTRKKGEINEVTSGFEKADIRDLIMDERHHISSARVGLWVSVLLAIGCLTVDIVLTVQGVAFRLPNTVYALLGTMFTVFSTWAAGPRIAQYIGPQIGAVAASLGSARRDSVEASAQAEAIERSFIPHTWTNGKEEGKI